MGWHGSVNKYWGHRNKKHKKQPFGDAKRIKTARRFTTKNPVGTWYFTSAHNCSIILNINNLSRTRSIASLPSKIVWEIWYDLLPRNHFFIRGFSPWNGERFLFLIPFTIRQHCIIYPQEFSTGPKKTVGGWSGVWAQKKGTVSRLSHFLKYTIIYKTTILNHV